MYDGAAHHCLTCGKPITWQFAICVKCETIYGRTSSEWPAWLSFMWRDYARERRRARIAAKREILVSDLTLGLAMEMQDGGAEEIL